MVWIWRALSSLLISGLQLMKVKQIKERDCYIRGVNTVINAADPSTIPLLVSGTQRTTSVPALRIIPPPRFDSHSQWSNWHKLRFHDNDMHQSANVRQPKQGELQHHGKSSFKFECTWWHLLSAGAKAGKFRQIGKLQGVYCSNTFAFTDLQMPSHESTVGKT